MKVVNTEAEQIFAVREFNRFYTARMGLLRKHHLGGEFSLTEARILYEIGARPGITASVLRDTLGLNPGYVSRSLALLTKRKLVSQKPSKRDGREKLLTLLPAGERTVAWLNEQSALQIQELLSGINSADRAILLDSFSKIRSILKETSGDSIQIVRLLKTNKEAIRLIEEYYEAVSVVRRDTPEAIQQIIDEPGAGMWLAYRNEKAVGCVVLKKLSSVSHAGECKRLYVQPGARGNRIAEKLLEAQEDFAREQGLRYIYLDTHDGLQAAIALYRKCGYVECERYNDNPQATLFFRKQIAP